MVKVVIFWCFYRESSTKTRGNHIIKRQTLFNFQPLQTCTIPSNPSLTAADVTAGHNARPRPFAPEGSESDASLPTQTPPFISIPPQHPHLHLHLRCTFPSSFPFPDPSMNRSNPSRPHHGGREDCWSDGATETLIEAWGDRYIQLNRGNLRQKDWTEVADSVNARQNGVKPRKTDIQCKNRIDTLKKKFKVEKSKPPPSKWVFYHRLDSLIGANGSVSDKKPTTVTLTVKSSKPKPSPSPIRRSALALHSGGSSRLDSGGGSMESSLGDDDDDDTDDFGFDGRTARKQRFETVDFSDGAALRELARAILKFGEIYERIESSKQQQMIELEKQRMEFTKDLEFQRMNMFMDTQLEVERMKRPKYATTSGKKM